MRSFRKLFTRKKQPPKIGIGDQVRIMQGSTVVGHMVLVEYSCNYNGSKEARLVDVGTYMGRNRIS